MGTHDSDCGGRTMADNNGLRLTYFKGSYGRGGPIRDILTLGGLPFEYEELTFQEFVERKGDLPFGSLPVLRVEGVERTQSNALLMYAGMLTGYYSPHGLVGLMTREVLGAVRTGMPCLETRGRSPTRRSRLPRGRPSSTAPSQPGSRPWRPSWPATALSRTPPGPSATPLALPSLISSSSPLSA